uniref:glycosyltransferase family 4 protein n=1 Tax=Clostridium beijerinckii TaxID=1520 RepID=UPI00047CB0E6
VHVVTFNGGNLRYTEKYVDEYECIDGVNIHRAPTIFYEEDMNLNFQLNSMSLVETALLVTQITRFDLIHFHGAVVATAAVFLSKRLGIPLYSTVHFTYGLNVDKHPYLKFLAQIEKITLRECDRVITVSDHMSQELNQLYDISSLLMVIPNGVNLQKFNGTNTGYIESLPSNFKGKKIVLFVGRLAEEKGVDYLLRSFNNILERDSEVRLLIAGQGRQELEIKSLCKKLNLENYVNFMGFINDTDICELYKVADVVVIPSTYEPFGLVALEAMASGKPIVVTSVGGLKDIPINNESGIIIPPGDENAIVEAVDKILSDNLFAKYLGKNALERAKEFDWNDIAKATIDAYNGKTNAKSSVSRT